jgi:tripartite-type tricarboxylate transporter receptor subunit TctC
LSKLSKYTALCLLLILASTMILSLGPTANAQDETAEVIILAAAGGTTDPAGSTTPNTYK